MTPTPPQTVLLPYNVNASVETYKDILTRKREVIAQLCGSLEEYLAFDIDVALEAVEHPTDVPPGHPQYKPTQEDFIQACDKVSELERLVETSRRAISAMSEEGTEGALRAGLSMSLQYTETNLKSATMLRDALQKALEQAEATS